MDIIRKIQYLLFCLLAIGLLLAMMMTTTVPKQVMKESCSIGRGSGCHSTTVVEFFSFDCQCRTYCYFDQKFRGMRINVKMIILSAI